MRYKKFLNHWKHTKNGFLVLSLLCLITCSLYGQKEQIALLTIGDMPPPLRIKNWIKGSPVIGFEKGKIYVVEFWATWCAPCKAAMPHLSDLAGIYKDKVIIIGVDILESETASIQKIKSFVDSMGNQMNYSVATEEANLMETGWLKASDAGQGIPASFVINSEGKLAWIGHPRYLDEVLTKVVNGTWDIKKALSKRNSDRYLRELDDSLNSELMIYRENDFKNDYRGKPELALKAIDEMVRKEPRLKYAPFIAYNTFTSLLKTNQDEAYKYGEVVLVTSTYEEPPYHFIYGAIQSYSNRLKLSAGIYELAVKAHQMEIDNVPYPQLINLPKIYSEMADLYWYANNKSKAIEFQKKAIDALTSKTDLPNEEIQKFKSQLQKYINMKL